MLRISKRTAQPPPKKMPYKPVPESAQMAALQNNIADWLDYNKDKKTVRHRGGRDHIALEMMRAAYTRYQEMPDSDGLTIIDKIVDKLVEIGIYGLNPAEVKAELLRIQITQIIKDEVIPKYYESSKLRTLGAEFS